MKKLIVVGVIAALAGCQKIDTDQPAAATGAKSSKGVTALTGIILYDLEGNWGFRTHFIEYKDGRIYHGREAEVFYYYTYDERKRTITLINEGATSNTYNTLTYRLNAAGCPVSMYDTIAYSGRPVLNSATEYYYHGAAYSGFSTTYYWGQTITTKIEALSPTLQRITEIYSNNSSGSVTHVTYRKKLSPTEIVTYDADMRVREVKTYSSSIRDPEYNLSSLPSFERITDRPAPEKSIGGPWLAGPSKQEAMFMISSKSYNANGQLTEESMRTDIIVNEANMPISYIENKNGSPLVLVKLTYTQL